MFSYLLFLCVRGEFEDGGVLGGMSAPRKINQSHYSHYSYLVVSPPAVSRWFHIDLGFLIGRR